MGHDDEILVKEEVETAVLVGPKGNPQFPDSMSQNIGIRSLEIGPLIRENLEQFCKFCLHLYPAVLKEFCQRAAALGVGVVLDVVDRFPPPN